MPQTELPVFKIRIRDLDKPRNKQAFDVLVRAESESAARNIVESRLKPLHRMCRRRPGKAVC